MKVLISEHDELAAYLRKHNHKIDCVETQLNVDKLCSADTVYGNLTFEQCLSLSKKNIKYMHLGFSHDLNSTPLLDNAITITPYQAKERKSNPLTPLFKHLANFIDTKRLALKKWKTSPWCIWILTTLSLVSFAWLTDLLAGNHLFHWLPGGTKAPDEPIAWVPTLVTLAIYFFCSVALINLGRSFLPSLRRINVDKNSKPKKVLVLTLSQIHFLTKQGDKVLIKPTINNKVQDAIPLKGDLIDDIKTLENCLPRWNGLQQMRAIVTHINKVEKIIILSTEDAGPGEFEKGTKNIASLFKAFIEGYVANNKCVVEISEPYLDPNDVGKIYNMICDVIDGVIKDPKYSDQDICLDITGGTSTVSCAGALATIHRKTQFQYVSTVGKNEVYQQDLQLAVSSASN
ncbi:hypothetical protein ACNUDM_08375 [Vibrio chaetopteri]|uniref:hypothetical protein n=1 Tax=Vibrio chaetopteri TaxID=3016528 RepID=UPI003AB31E98